jgi:hypothetical protein
LFHSVSCGATSFCMGVGQPKYVIFHGSLKRTNPNKLWSKPKPLDAKGILTSVSCPSRSLCVATDLNGSALVYKH